ncbi:FAD-dependent oxidoreductase [Steroidobacter sp. S1-65]|uniref:FAD-dependent oxidoreductase n=1 Tax=Steroidobacter gossypii TaxID=2805490 RepID=A0ABS1WQ82_9GAMM|nr:FAD-dependent oxidoreductase [Steroidobacter gossypii]MBM0103134.1 FAD-dependent oxidoreductase [Steroidobacter gossypii]
MALPAPIESIIVFSHLRWSFVFQRPQQLLSRLARRYRIHFFEEPVPAQAEPGLVIDAPSPNVRVYRPHSTAASAGFHDDHIPALQQLVRDVIRDEHIENYAVWFYSPMALPLMQELTPLAVVYDCMDELAAFHNAPRQLLQRENALLKRADLVFTGGPSLYRSKRDRHHNVHCFPSSVDADHFRGALVPGEDHPLQQALAKPRLGYFGVIDERLDLELLAQLADARADWQICMVGPVVKIDPGSLPQRPNLHYFGQQPYDDLPRFIAGWQVCLQPFALNEATRFISPTKTLEYMAAERPIVSTAITDVVEPYGHIVRIANDRSAFVEECRHALQMSDEEARAGAQLMRAQAASTSWEQTAEKMGALLDEITPKPSSSANLPATIEGSSPRPEVRTACREYSTVIIGAGPTGLSAAYHLGEGSLLLEQNETVGGWCRSVIDGGFTFDYAGHIMFSNDPYVHQMYQRLLGSNVHWQDREAWIFSKNVYTRYPFQGALHGLPPDVLKECIVGAIEARFGRLDGKAPTNPDPGDSSTASCKAESITDCCGDGVIESTARLADPPNGARRTGEPANFEEFIYKVWGTGVAKHFAIPYNRKLWAVPLTEMETSWLGGRVPLPNLEEMIEGALRPVGKPVGPNARFGYPLRGGFQALMNGFLPLLEGEVRTHAQVSKVSTRTHTVTLTDGSRYRYRHLVSTAPLPKLIEMIGAEAPEEIRAAARSLRHVSVRCVNLGVAREQVTDKHWIYYPEDTVFHRIFVQGNASPLCNPPGGFGLTCEITYSPDKPLPCEGEALIERCIKDCIGVGLLLESDRILVRNQVDMPYAYVVYDHVRKHNVELIRQWLLKRSILLAGRYSEWEYYNSDHAFIAGKKVAEAVRRSAVSKEPAYRVSKGAAADGPGVAERATL